MDIINKHKVPFKGVEGAVVTRFPPEPSGYLHIGHAKAAIMNYSYARKFNGKMILRFDDTNPSKENVEFVENIREDLKTLGIVPDTISFTSDYSDKFIEMMDQMINNGFSYADDTPADKMKEERDEGIESGNRNNTIEKNMTIWKEMQTGSVEGIRWCIRGKIDMQEKNKCLRDPVFYRCNLTPHHRTGTKYKVYPTYDFACPIIDSIEGVTNAGRTVEYHDRNTMYKWVIKSTGIRDVEIYDFSRLNFVSTVLSKRLLQQVVDIGFASGWNDPRFPTIQGIMRRGLTIPAIHEFMLEQGPSRATNLMEWDKLWNINKKVIDPIAPRFVAIAALNKSYFIIDNVDEKLYAEVQGLHPKNKEVGTKPCFFYNKLIIETQDAKDLKIDEKITLMKWGNATIKNIKEKEGSYYITGSIDTSDKDFKKTKKLTWLANNEQILVEVLGVEFGSLITKESLEDGDNILNFLNQNSRKETRMLGEGVMRTLKEGEIIQIERRGFYYVDKPCGSNEKHILTLHFIPDGHQQKKPKEEAKEKGKEGEIVKKSSRQLKKEAYDKKKQAAAEKAAGEGIKAPEEVKEIIKTEEKKE